MNPEQFEVVRELMKNMAPPFRRIAMLVEEGFTEVVGAATGLVDALPKCEGCTRIATHATADAYLCTDHASPFPGEVQPLKWGKAAQKMNRILRRWRTREKKSGMHAVAAGAEQWTGRCKECGAILSVPDASTVVRVECGREHQIHHANGSVTRLDESGIPVMEDSTQAPTPPKPAVPPPPAPGVPQPRRLGHPSIPMDLRVTRQDLRPVNPRSTVFLQSRPISSPAIPREEPPSEPKK